VSFPFDVILCLYVPAFSQRLCALCLYPRDPGNIFYGCWFSTFTGYINRLRGYHTDDHQLPGFKEGVIPSYYYALEDRFDHMQSYYPVKKSFYAREFPTSWRLIDASIEEDLLEQQPASPK
jgi:hypothetical protein